MKLHPLKKSFIFFIFAVLIPSLILYAPINSITYSMSIEDEDIFGRKFLSEIRRHFEFVEDEFSVMYINQLGNYISKYVDIRYFPFRFYIIKNDTLNAFAGPGGHIFIFTGRIERLQSADELSSIISHEIGHVSGRHISERVEKNKKIGLATLAGVLAGILAGGKASGAIITGSIAAGKQAQLYYSREDERHADQLGFKYMERSGFDPSAMIEVLKRIQKEQLTGPGDIPSYLLTHPGASERISNIEIMMNQYLKKPPPPEVTKLRRLFPFFRISIGTQYGSTGFWEQTLRKELKRNPNSLTALFGMGLIKKRELDYKDAVQYLSRANKLSPHNLPVILALAKTYQLKGDYQKALKQIKRAYALAPGNKSILYMYGMIYQQLELYRKAIPIFEQLSSPAPFKNEVFYNLGICYGRLGKLARAHYYFGLFFKRKDMPEKAKLHFKKAKALAKGESVELKDKIDKELN